MNQSSRFRFTSQWKSQAWQLSLLCGAACMVPLAGCGGSDHGGDAPVTVQPTTQRPTDSESSAKGGLTGKIKFKAGQGDTEFSVKPQDDGAKLVDSDEQEIARFNLSDSKLKVKDADDTVLGYVIASPGKYKIKNSAQDVELWQLQRQDDGDWKLEDGQEKLIYKIKK
ncbi:MAG: hypothetical protein QGG71_24145, partial [Pirellulaceae bacterium]|nr:hypothetical protein [Pirellulaceae bacterium]